MPLVISLGISAYMAKKDVIKGLRYKSFLEQKVDNLEDIERTLRSRKSFEK